MDGRAWTIAARSLVPLVVSAVLVALLGRGRSSVVARSRSARPSRADPVNKPLITYDAQLTAASLRRT